MAHVITHNPSPLKSPIVQLFLSLKDKASRRTALNELIAELDPQEWREFTQIFSSRTFQLDPISHLPLEIVIRIFFFLDPAATFLYRRVSKPWMRVLSSEKLYKSILRTWYTKHDPPLLGELLYPSKSEFDHSYLKLEQLQRFKSARPKAVISLSTEHNATVCDLFGVWVAWRPIDGRNIIALNMQTGQTILFRTEAHEQIQEHFLTQKLLTVTTFSGCYAIDLETGVKKSCRLPSAYAQLFRGEDSMVPIIFSERAKGDKMIIWDCQTGKTHMFDLSNVVEANAPFRGHFKRYESNTIVQVHSAEREVTVRSVSLGPEGTCILFQRFNIFGQLLKQEITLPFVDEPQMVLLQGHPSDFHRGLCFVCSRLETDNREHLLFDIINGKKSMMDTNCFTNSYNATDGAMLWKDVQILRVGRAIKIAPANATPKTLIPEEGLPTIGRLVAPRGPFGNEIFLGVVDFDRIILWSFDPDAEFKNLASNKHFKISSYYVDK